MRIASRLIFAIATIVIGITVPAHAQQIAAPDSISRALVSQMPVYDSLLGASVEDKLNVLPRVDYNDKPKPYIIGKIRVHGAVAVDPQMIIDNLGLAAGDTITVPGDAITIAIRGLLDRRFFANMKAATSYREDTVDIDLYLRERIQVRGWDFIGAKNTEKKDLEEKLRLRQYSELSDYLLSTCMDLIRKYYDEKAFRNAEISYAITPDTLVKTAVLVHFTIDRGEKVKIGEIQFDGNQNLSSKKLTKSMEKTHKVSINFLRSAKFKEKDFEEDLENIRNYARSEGYRDAEILQDSLYAIPDKPKARQEVATSVVSASRYEDMLGTYLVKLSSNRVSDADSAEVTELLKMIGDFERISDHAVNVLESAEELRQKGLSFSEAAMDELRSLTGAVGEILDLSMDAFVRSDLEAAAKVEPLEQVVDDLKESMRTRHMIRLQRGECSIDAGFVWSDLLTDLERVADHCSNIAGCVLDAARNNVGLHEALREFRVDNQEFMDQYDRFAGRYALSDMNDQITI